MKETKMQDTAVYEFKRRLGTTNYVVKVRFSEDSTETMEDKILRLVRNEALQLPKECDMLELPQMSRQPERSAS